jgi:hypothetical protein
MEKNYKVYKNHFSAGLSLSMRALPFIGKEIGGNTLIIKYWRIIFKSQKIIYFHYINKVFLKIKLIIVCIFI